MRLGDGIIWVILATVCIMVAVATVKSAENQKQIRQEQVVLARQAKDAVITTRAACSYRAYLRRQATQGEDFLRKHPEGLQSIGISNGQLRHTIGLQKKAAASLAGLVCTGKALAPPPPATTPVTTTSP